MNKTSIGQRNQLVVIEKPVSTKNTLGEDEVEWQEFTKAWAKVTNKTAGELDAGGRLVSVATYWFICHHIDGVDNNMRINWDGKLLNIADAHDPDGTREATKITAFMHGG